MHVFYGHDGAVNSVNFNKSGNQIISASSDKSVKIWSVSTEIIVDFYFGDEVKAELTQSDLFLPKQKNEERKAYQLRLEEAKTYKKEVYDKYFERYKSEKF